MKTANPMKIGLTKRRSNSLRCLDCGSGSIHRFTVNTNEETMTTSGILAGLFFRNDVHLVPKRKAKGSMRHVTIV